MYLIDGYLPLLPTVTRAHSVSHIFLNDSLVQANMQIRLLPVLGVFAGSSLLDGFSAPNYASHTLTGSSVKQVSHQKHQARSTDPSLLGFNCI